MCGPVAGWSGEPAGIGGFLPARGPSRRAAGTGLKGDGAIFFGAEPVAFDAKKTRLSVPSAFRAVLAQGGDQDVVVRPSNHSPCIDVWPKAVFQAEVERRTRDLDPFSEEFDTITDGLTVQAYDTRVDADGRIALPKLLLAEVPLDASAVIVGRRSFFQIWSAPAWAERQAAAKSQPQPRPAPEGASA